MAVVTLLAATPAPAEDLWGCEVLLCLANPGGPDEIAACRPIMARLRHHLSRKRPFPACPQASVQPTPSGSGQSRAVGEAAQ